MNMKIIKAIQNWWNNINEELVCAMFADLTSKTLDANLDVEEDDDAIWKDCPVRPVWEEGG